MYITRVQCLLKTTLSWEHIVCASPSCVSSPQSIACPSAQLFWDDISLSQGWFWKFLKIVLSKTPLPDYKPAFLLWNYWSSLYVLDICQMYFVNVLLVRAFLIDFLKVNLDEQKFSFLIKSNYQFFMHFFFPPLRNLCLPPRHGSTLL